MKVARLLITHELLMEALHLPSTAVVIDIRHADQLGAFEVKIVDESLTEVQEGENIPLQSAYLRVETPDCGCTNVSWEWVER